MNRIEDYDIRLLKAAIYRQHIQESDDAGEVSGFIDEYLETGNEDVLDTIEAKYPLTVIRDANFRAGCMYQERIMPFGKIRQFCMKRGIECSFAKFCVILLCLMLATAYQVNFRYKYRTYKDSFGRVQVIKVDRLTGKSIFYYPEYIEQKKAKENKPE